MKSTVWFLFLLSGAGLLGCSSPESPTTRLEEVYYDSYEFSLPALTGEYAFDGGGANPPHGRISTFRLPENMQSFRELRMVVGGTWVRGLLETRTAVDGFVYSDTTTLIVHLALRLRPIEGNEAVFEARVNPGGNGATEPIEFVAQGDFGFSYWNPEVGGLLLADDVVATLTIERTIGINQVVLVPSFGTMVDLRLEFLGVVMLEEREINDNPFSP